MNETSATVAFVAAATALLGSPGPGIAALIAVGRGYGRASAFRFYGSMQVGLALAAGLSAFGLAGFLKAVPAVELFVLIAATLYLLWLAWQIATAPISGTAAEGLDADRLTNRAAFFLGFANPKAYLAFASLFGSFEFAPLASAWVDGSLKLLLCVIVMALADLAWMLLGMALGRVGLSPRAERGLNITMGAIILAACLMTWL